LQIAIADSNDDARGRAKRLWITLLRCNKGVRFAHGAFDWEGCGSPLPNPPRRFATNRNHGNDQQHVS